MKIYFNRGIMFMNVVFISPNFPKNFYNFCRALRENYVRVLGIGDEKYENLDENVKMYLNDYYEVDSLENYDSVLRGCGYFTYKYGHIDFIESNNEYWLMQDAMLRTDFNVASGIKVDEIKYIRYKSEMKKCYKKAKVKTARFHLVDTFEKAKKFIDEVGYPVVVKPDDGVGASETHKLKCEQDLIDFFNYPHQHQMIMEEFVNGDLISYDGIANSRQDVIYETGHIFPFQVMNIVNDELDCFYYSRKEIPEDLRKAGQAVIKAFPCRSRCFHLEFFRLREDKKGLGKKGDLIGLEVNMRPPGRPTLDMMNYAADIDVYRIWANMVVYDEALIDSTHKKYYTVYAARRKKHTYKIELEDIKKEYEDNIVMEEDMPEITAGAMGDHYLIARFEDKEAIDPFVKKVIEADSYADELL